MNSHHIVFCNVFFTVLWHINTVSSEDVREVPEGGTITVGCSFYWSGNNKKFVCRKECKNEDVLIETRDDREQKGRYSIKDERTGVFYVTIRQLTKSDSGKYWCGVERRVRNSYQEFSIRVKDASPASTHSPDSPTSTYSPASTYSPDSPASTHSPDSPASTHSPDSPASSTFPPTTSHTTEASSAAAGLLLYVGVALVVLVTTLGLAMLFLCRKRTSKTPEPSNPPVGTDYAAVAEADCVYEEIREEDRQGKSHPVEISTVYSYAHYTSPAGVNPSTDAGGPGDAADPNCASADRPKSTSEDDSSDVTYHEVDFSKDTSDAPNPPTADSLHGAPGGSADDLVYSLAQFATAETYNLPKDTPMTLYSAVKLPEH